MPTAQRMLDMANGMLNRVNIDKFDETLVTLEEPISDETYLSQGLTRAEVDYLRSWPESLKMAIRAALYSAVRRRPRVPVTMAWAPGYDFELTVWEAPGTRESVGEVTILLRSRYPGDSHPAKAQS